jgi:endonuclease III
MGRDMTAPKRPFDIGQVIRRIRVAVRPFAKAAMFELADDGFSSPFEQLVACIISIRTRDEVTVPTARRLFARARTPLDVSRLTSREIVQLIRACAFHERKAQQILRIARRAVDEYKGGLPCEAEALLSFEGVGPKCANLVLGIACDQPRVSVDIHVHRVTNRWGYVTTRTPGSRSKASSRAVTGSRSTACSSRSANTSARARCRDARNALCLNSAAKSALKGIANWRSIARERLRGWPIDQPRSRLRAVLRFNERYGAAWWRGR